MDDLSSPWLQQKLKDFAHWVAHGANALEKWLKSPAFHQDMASLESGFDNIVKKLPTLTEALTDASKAIISVYNLYESILHRNRPDAMPAPKASAAKKYQKTLQEAQHATTHAQFESAIMGAYIAKASAKYHVPSRFLQNQMMTESGGNPRAVSPKGAMGLMQFMPGTWKQWGHGSIWDPKQQVDAAARYDAWLKRKTGSWKGAAIAYNEGIGAYEHGARYKGVESYARDLLAGITKHVGEHIQVQILEADGSRLNAYRKFKSLGAAYRTMAATVSSYGRHTLAGILATYEGKKPSTKNVQAASQ
ncbi:MAG: lytic transglycosylase domain-containing protein, partial [Thiomonas sp.]